MLKIKFREEESTHPLQAICPWIDFITPDLILDKDGGLLAAFEYRGIDPDNLYDEKIDSETMQLQRAYAQLDERIIAWWIVDKRKDTSYPESNFANETAEKIDKIYSKQFTSGEHYSITYRLFFLFVGDTGANKFIDRVARIQKENKSNILKAIVGATKESLSGQSAFSVENGLLKENIYNFERLITGFLNMAPIKTTRLIGDEFSTALSSILNKATTSKKVRKPSMAMLDSWLPNNYVDAGADIIRFRGNTDTVYAGVLGLVKWPEFTTPLLFEKVLKMDVELTICQIIRFLGQEASSAEINKAIEYYNLSKYGLVSHAIAKATNGEATPKAGMQQLLEQCEEALERIGESGINYAYQNTNVFVYADSKQNLKRNIDHVSQRLAETHFVSVRERINTLPSFASMLPGQWSQQTRYDLVSIENCADMTPIYTMEEGSDTHEFFSEMIYQKDVPVFTTFGNSYGGRAHFSPHVGQVGHMVIIAPTGGGKTTFVNFIASQFQRYGEVNTFIFDRNYSCKAVTELHHGKHIDIKTKDKGFNPFFALKDGTADGALWLREFIIHRMEEGGYKTSAEDREIIDARLDLVSKQRNPRIHSFAALLPRHLTILLSEWMDGGPYGMFDCEEDSFEISNWTTIEMREIMSNDRIARAFMEYAFRKIYISLDGRPTFIYLEEASFLLNNPIFKDMIDDWLKTFRKKNAFIWMTIQSPTSITSTEIAASLLDNVFSFLMLFNAKVESHREAYKKMFAMDDYQVDQIANLRKNKEYLLIQDKVSRVLSTSFNKEVLAYIRSEQTCINLMEKLQASGREDWREEYLQQVVKMK